MSKVNDNEVFSNLSNYYNINSNGSVVVKASNSEGAVNSNRHKNVFHYAQQLNY